MHTTTDSDYLFVYGTLRPAFENPFARYLRQSSQYVGEGTFPGLLFDLGNYPGATFRQDSAQKVFGSVYCIEQHKQALLDYLDEYEGIDGNAGQPAEYSRTLIPVSIHQKLITCWVYLYNLPVISKPVILSGEYRPYKKSSGFH